MGRPRRPLLARAGAECDDSTGTEARVEATITVITHQSGSARAVVVQHAGDNDAAVGLAYPAAVGLVDEFSFGINTPPPKFGGVGTWGIQGISAAESLKMQNEQEGYSFKPRGIYNIDGSLFIPSHSGIDGPQVAHLLWQVARAGASA